jgi:two-component system, cell cycle sensor histidine kinase and response regulator CckA
MDQTLSHRSARSSGEMASPFTRWLGGLAQPDWVAIGTAVRGPLLTLAVTVLLDVLRRRGVGLLSPFPVLLLTVVYAATVGGLRPALVSVVITSLYAVHFFAEPGLPLRYDPQGLASLLAVAAASLATGLVVARLRDRVRVAEADALTAGDAEALARRYGLLEQASLLFTSARDFETMFRDFSRLVVPTLADWCTIHLAGDDAVVRFVAGAHRDASRDLVVRALADYRRPPPFDRAPLVPEVVSVSDALLREVAVDEEELKLYRALAPTAVLRVPLGASSSAGVLTLAMVAETGRHFAAADISLAEEIGETVGLAVENVRLKDEAAQAARRARLVFEAHPQPMWVFDVDTLAILAVNDAAVYAYGWSRDEFLTMTIMDLLAPDDPSPGLAGTVERVGQRGEAALARHRRRDGSVVEMEIISHELELDGRRVRLVQATDVTERTRARAALHESEEHLRRVQREEAMGRIAGGVAHDFNNLLTTIRGFGEMLLLDMVPDDRRRHDVERICQAADRGALLTRQLLSFGRNQAQEPRPVNLNDIIRGMEPLTRRLVGADVELDLRLASNLGQVHIDPAQIEHVVVNLILNARDAMPAGGRLTIETGERRISGLSRGRPVRPGRYVVLEVGDTGPGLDAEQGGEAGVPRTDLGRAIVFGIVRQYGGVVRVSSEAGVGTMVKVYLPRLDMSDSMEQDDLGAGSLRGAETILVAEDEDGVRELLRKVLVEFGYTVLTARHGRDALMLAQERPGGIDLLVTDIVMPEMSGRELAETLTDQAPDLKVLYISGYTDDEVLHRGVRGREVPLVRKPFAAEDLVRRVRAILDGGA